MYRMRESWTDERLDDFRGEVNRGFDEVDRRFDKVDRRFDKVESEVNRRFSEVDQKFERRFDSVDHELHRVNGRLDALHRGLFQVGGGIIVALVGIIVTQL
jgi:hypothetical protein